MIAQRRNVHADVLWWKINLDFTQVLQQSAILGRKLRTLGLYISNPRTPPETDKQFSEPGLFVINPEGKAHVIDISNAPFARPDLAQVLNGIKFAREKKFPVRGTVD